MPGTRSVLRLEEKNDSGNRSESRRSASEAIDLPGSQPVEHRADPKRSPSETLAARSGARFVFGRCPYNTGRPSPSGLGLAVM